MNRWTSQQWFHDLILHLLLLNWRNFYKSCIRIIFQRLIELFFICTRLKILSLNILTSDQRTFCSASMMRRLQITKLFVTNISVIWRSHKLKNCKINNRHHFEHWDWIIDTDSNRQESYVMKTFFWDYTIRLDENSSHSMRQSSNASHSEKRCSQTRH